MRIPAAALSRPEHRGPAASCGDTEWKAGPVGGGGRDTGHSVGGPSGGWAGHRDVTQDVVLCPRRPWVPSPRGVWLAVSRTRCQHWGSPHTAAWARGGPGGVAWLRGPGLGPRRGLAGLAAACCVPLRGWGHPAATQGRADVLDLCERDIGGSRGRVRALPSPTASVGVGMGWRGQCALRGQALEGQGLRRKVFSGRPVDVSRLSRPGGRSIHLRWG